MAGARARSIGGYLQSVSMIANARHQPLLDWNEVIERESGKHKRGVKIATIGRPDVCAYRAGARGYAIVNHRYRRY